MLSNFVTRIKKRKKEKKKKNKKITRFYQRVSISLFKKTGKFPYPSIVWNAWNLWSVTWKRDSKKNDEKENRLWMVRRRRRWRGRSREETKMVRWWCARRTVAACNGHWRRAFAWAILISRTPRHTDHGDGRRVGAVRANAIDPWPGTLKPGGYLTHDARRRPIVAARHRAYSRPSSLAIISDEERKRRGGGREEEKRIQASLILIRLIMVTWPRSLWISLVSDVTRRHYFYVSFVWLYNETNVPKDTQSFTISA